MRGGINDSVRAAPDDSSGFGARKNNCRITGGGRKRAASCTEKAKQIGRVKSSANAIIKEVISENTN